MPFNKDQHAWVAKVIPGRKSASAGPGMTGHAVTAASATTGYEVFDGSEDGPGHTSMALPDPHAKPAKPKTHVIDFSSEDAEETNQDMQDVTDAHAAKRNDATPLSDARKQELMTALSNIEKQAGLNALGFTVEVLYAYEDFKKAAKPRVDELKKRSEEAKDLVGSLANGLIGVAGGALVAKVTGEAVKVIAEQIKDAFKEQMVKQAQAAAKAGEDLDAGMEAIAQGFRDYASAVKGTVDDVIGPWKSGAEDAIRSGKMGFRDLKALQPFVGVATAKLNDLLYAWCGIPGPAKAKDIRMQMFHAMMLRLDERYLARTAETTEDKSRAFMDAHSMADHDTDKRYEEMRVAKKTAKH